MYRKATDKLIDWNIRKHPDQQAVEESKIDDGYDTTNLWKIHPANHPKHPAVFPLELAEKVIKYYSFKKDVVLDPFAGTGTVGKAAIKLGRRFVLFEQDAEYLKIIQEEIHEWLHNKVKEVNWINTQALESQKLYINF